MFSLKNVRLSRIYFRYKLFNLSLKQSFCTNNVIHKNILSSGLADVEIPEVSLPEILFPKYELYEKYTAFECAETKRSYTNSQLIKQAINLSKSLRKRLKLNQGEVVASVIPNIPEGTIVLLGILKGQLVLSPISPVFTQYEIARQLLDSNSKTIITTVEMYPTVEKAIKEIRKKIPVITIKTQKDQVTPVGAIDFKEFAENEIDYPDIPFPKSSDLALLPYSSGTTGLPKGVELTHSNLVSNLCQNVLVEKYRYFQNASSDFQEVIPGVLPFYHIYGLQTLFCSPGYLGAKVITLSSFTPELYISVLKNNKCSLQYVAPPLILFLTANPDVKVEYLKDTRYILSGAAPLGASDENRFIEKFGNHICILQGYGLTESSPGIAVNNKILISEKREESKGSIGHPMVNTLVKIVSIDDPKNEPLGPNICGELLAKGPQVMRRYHNRPEETKNTLVDDGWLRTGDMAYYNEHGMIFITDRLKELIKVKGLQVPPAELEEIVRTYPDVTDAAVIGIPHAKYGEVPRAYVVTKPNRQIDLEKLDEYVTEKVAKYKRLLGGIEVVETIPKNISGKILRRKIREEYDKQVLKLKQSV